MSKTTPEQRSLSAADRLERRLNRLLAAQRKQLKNENILRLEPNGDISYERIRTVAVPATPTRSVSEGTADRMSNESAPTALEPDPAPNNFPETPHSSKNGNIFAPETAPASLEPVADLPPQPQSDSPLAPRGCGSPRTTACAADAPISFHEAATAGKEISSPADADAADPLEDLLARALARPRRGRPAAFDERNKGQLVALLSLGMSLRQAASVLGVSHTTIRNTLQADATLAEEITAARFQAQLQPLACVIREARRSWKAATWLLKYLDHKIATHEETPDERIARQDRERAEFFAKPFPGSKKK